jgi:hypothetical protein
LHYSEKVDLLLSKLWVLMKKLLLLLLVNDSSLSLKLSLLLLLQPL